MAKVNFTTTRVEAHGCPEGKSQAFLWDEKTPGLGLRATANGAKAYIFQSKVHGNTVRMTIGDPRNWGIDDAQKEARRMQRLVDGGIDPRSHKAEKRAAHEAEQASKRRDSVDVFEAWASYLKYLQNKISPKTKKPRSAKYIEDHVKFASLGGGQTKRGGKTTARGTLAPLMALRLSDLTSSTVAAWLESESVDRPTSAAYAFRMLKAFVRWCEGQDAYSGIIPADCCTSSRVTSVVPKSNVKEGDSLQREQLASWFAAVQGLQNPILAAYLQGLIITGARREELAALKWSDVDFRWRSISLADKIETETGRIIPLPPFLASILCALPRRNEWVFSSENSESGRIAEPRYAHNQAIEIAGLPHVTLHGLRRSFGTLAEWCEVPVGVVAQIQGHKPSALAEKHYRRRPLDMLRMWHDKIEAWMLVQAEIHFVPDGEKAGL
jgi:integrase